MNLLTHLLRCATRSPIILRAPSHPMIDLSEVDQLPAEDALAPVCGWFDSSWELRQGLQVSEQAMERVQRHVPLSWLLQ